MSKCWSWGVAHLQNVCLACPWPWIKSPALRRQDLIKFKDAESSNVLREPASVCPGSMRSWEPLEANMLNL